MLCQPGGILHSRLFISAGHCPGEAQGHLLCCRAIQSKQVSASLLGEAGEVTLGACFVLFPY